jgi:hypothetical protein
MVYGTDNAAPHKFVRYDPKANTFTHMNAELPANLLNWPTKKSPDGAFYVMDRYGEMFKLYPEQDRVENLGTSWISRNWQRKPWIENMELSPGGRYLYYVAESSDGASVGLPLVQYDTLTQRKKVIAFLEEYYLKHHQIGIQGVWGIALSADGGSVFASANGSYGRPGYGLMVMLEIHIPESERADDSVP